MCYDNSSMIGRRIGADVGKVQIERHHYTAFAPADRFLQSSATRPSRWQSGNHRLPDWGRSLNHPSQKARAGKSNLRRTASKIRSHKSGMAASSEVHGASHCQIGCYDNPTCCFWCNCREPLTLALDFGRFFADTFSGGSA